MSFMSYILNAVRDDRAYGEMLRAAVDRLAGRDPLDVALKSGIPYDSGSGELSWDSFGQRVTVSGTDWTVRGALGNWHSLTILHYLEMADGAMLTGDMISFGQQRDGLARGGDFDRRCENILGRALGNLAIREAEERCRRMGGKIIASNADVGCVFTPMPRYPLTLKLWLADEDLDGSARLFLDSSCDHYLTIEDSVTVGTILMEELQKE